MLPCIWKTPWGAMITFGNRYFGLNTAYTLQCSLLRWMYATDSNLFITLYTIPAKIGPSDTSVRKMQFQISSRKDQIEATYWRQFKIQSTQCKNKLVLNLIIIKAYIYIYTYLNPWHISQECTYWPKGLQAYNIEFKPW